MACEICGKSSCTRCFHSLEEQEEFDTKTGRYEPVLDIPEPNGFQEPEDMPKPVKTDLF